MKTIQIERPIKPIKIVRFLPNFSAIFPAKTTYLYFMKNKGNTHDFSSNYSTHLRNIERATK
jgi:UPF0755 protein